MALHAAHEYLRPAVTLAADNYATATGTTGTAVDGQNFEDCLVMFDIGDVTGTGTVDVRIQESDVTGSGWADITGAVFTQVTTAASNDLKLYVGRIHLGGRKRYLRAFAAIANVAADMSVHCILTSGISLPVTQANTTVFNLDPT